MTDEARRALIEAYQRWQPDSGITAEELANEHGVTRSAMYALLRREGIDLKTGRASPGLRGQEPLFGDMSRIALGVILDQLNDLKNENRRLKAENEQLQVRLADELAAHRPPNGGNGTPPNGISKRSG